jgi:hypothetical protein
MNEARSDWRAVLTRTERLGTRLLIRVRLLQHRREPRRVVLTTEALRLDTVAAELPIAGSTERRLDGHDVQRCRCEFARAVVNVIESREP